jgi:hypothetical protein
LKALGSHGACSSVAGGPDRWKTPGHRPDPSPQASSRSIRWLAPPQRAVPGSPEWPAHRPAQGSRPRCRPRPGSVRCGSSNENVLHAEGSQGCYGHSETGPCRSQSSLHKLEASMHLIAVMPGIRTRLTVQSIAGWRIDSAHMARKRRKIETCARRAHAFA